MPHFRVWYRDNPEPLEFATAYRPSELQIVEQILSHEKIGTPDAGANGSTASALIAANSLAPVRYTEDESEINVIA